MKLKGVKIDDISYLTIRDALWSSSYTIRQAARGACLRKGLPLEEAMDWLFDENPYVREIAIETLANTADNVPLSIIEAGLQDQSKSVKEATVQACQKTNVPLDVIRAWSKSDDDYRRMAAMSASIGRNVPVDIVEQGLRDKNWDVMAIAEDALPDNVPLSTIERWLSDRDYVMRQAAAQCCKGRQDVPVEIYMKGLADREADCGVKEKMGAACRGAKIPVNTIKEWASSYDKYLREAAIYACIGRNDVPFDIVQNTLARLDFSSWLAAEACEGKNIPLGTIMLWQEHSNAVVRRAAIHACKGRKNILMLFFKKRISRRKQ